MGIVRNAPNGARKLLTSAVSNSKKYNHLYSNVV